VTTRAGTPPGGETAARPGEPAAGDGAPRDDAPTEGAAGTRAGAETSTRGRSGLLRRRLSLRTRLALLFPLATLALTSVLVFGTMVTLRATELADREADAKAHAYRNAGLVIVRVGGPTAQAAAIGAAADELEREGGEEVLIEVKGKEYSPNPSRFNADDVPLAMRQSLQRASVVPGTAAIQRVELGGDPFLIVGVDLPSINTTYFELTPLADLQRTLDSMALALPGATAVITILAALLGRWFARAALAPLGDIRRAAAAVAAQRLDTRLPATTDPELSAIVDAFNDMVAALQERIARDVRFASDVSHELRSPLMTLSASVDVLQRRRDELGDRAAAALDLLAADVDRFQSLVADLLEISRFDSGAQQLEIEEVLAADFLAAVARQSAGRAVEVRLPSGGDRLIINVDKRRVVQMLSNLIENAAKYGDGVRMVTLDLVDGGVEIGVEDGGPGVPEAERELIFDRFARGASAGRRGSDTGTGLGLSLVAEHVRLHGGRIWCEAATTGDTGARFAFFLPTVVDYDLESNEVIDMSAATSAR